MNFITGLLEIGIGVALLGFGLFLFYALRPLFYGLFGAALGLWIGHLISGNAAGDPGILGWALALGGAILFALISNYAAPFLRIFLGALMGASLGFGIAAALDWWTWVGWVLALLGALAFAIALPLAFDPLIVLASIISGASLIMNGAFLATGIQWFNTSAGGAMSLILWLALVGVGFFWQFSNIKRWVNKQMQEQLRIQTQTWVGK